MGIGRSAQGLKAPEGCGPGLPFKFRSLKGRRGGIAGGGVVGAASQQRLPEEKLALRLRQGAHRLRKGRDDFQGVDSAFVGKAEGEGRVGLGCCAGGFQGSAALVDESSVQCEGILRCFALQGPMPEHGDPLLQQRERIHRLAGLEVVDGPGPEKGKGAGPEGLTGQKREGAFGKASLGGELRPAEAQLAENGLIRRGHPFRSGDHRIQG